MSRLIICETRQDAATLQPFVADDVTVISTGTVIGSRGFDAVLVLRFPRPTGWSEWIDESVRTRLNAPGLRVCFV